MGAGSCLQQRGSAPTFPGGVRCRPTPTLRKFAVVGELDGSAPRPLQPAILNALRRDRPAQVAVDLRDVTFLDAAGLTMLVGLRVDAEQPQLHLGAVPGFEPGGVAGFVAVVPPEEGATRARSDVSALC